MARLGKVRITPKGAYTEGTEYTYLDTVNFEGNSWVALKTSTDIEPTEGEYWTLHAQGFGQVDFEEAEEDEDIESGDLTQTIFGKLLKNIKTLRHNIGVLTTEKIDKSAIVNQDAINDVNKVPSSAVTYAHGQAITQLNNNFAVQTSTLVTENCAYAWGVGNTPVTVKDKNKALCTGVIVPLVGVAGTVLFNTGIITPAEQFFTQFNEDSGIIMLKILTNGDVVIPYDALSSVNRAVYINFLYRLV